jgi:hypothetical protein
MIWHNGPPVDLLSNARLPQLGASLSTLACNRLWKLDFDGINLRRVDLCEYSLQAHERVFRTALFICILEIVMYSRILDLVLVQPSQPRIEPEYVVPVKMVQVAMR